MAAIGQHGHGQGPSQPVQSLGQQPFAGRPGEHGARKGHGRRPFGPPRLVAAGEQEMAGLAGQGVEQAAAGRPGLGHQRA